MTSLLVLVAGEFQRLRKYKILAASVVVALIWIAVLALVDVRDVTMLLPFVLFIDVTTMPIILVGAAVFFEREEGSIKSMLVSPISKEAYCVSKLVSTIASSVLTLVLLYLYAILFKEVNINFPALLGTVALVALFHSLLGFVSTFRCREFTTLLMDMFKYFMLLVLPVLLEFTGVIQHELLARLFYLLPTRASLTLLLAPAIGADSGEILYSLGYLLVGSAILFLVVMKRLDRFAASESGGL